MLRQKGTVLVKFSTLVIMVLVLTLITVSGPSFARDWEDDIEILVPPIVEPTEPIPDDVYAHIEMCACEIAADRFKVPMEDVVPLKIVTVSWADASLGCPMGELLAVDDEPVLISVDEEFSKSVSGYLAAVTVRGHHYGVHMDDRGMGFVCMDISVAP